MNWLLLLAAVVVGTWNGNWFPSGRADHRAHPAVEEATIVAAAQMLAAGLDRIDPERQHDVVLCFNEIRNAQVASNLVRRIGRKGLRVAAVSSYRRRDRLDQQQDVIATTLPTVDSGWHRFAVAGSETPPRGYVVATVVVPPAITTGVYAVHLKSNYGANDEKTFQLNRSKRTRAMSAVIAAEDRRGGSRSPAIVAGDFNVDKWRSEFLGEPLFAMLEESGYLNLLQLLPRGKRGTHPSRSYGNSALDYIFVRGFDSKALPCVLPNEGLSDHCALFTLVSPVESESVAAKQD